MSMIHRSVSFRANTVAELGDALRVALAEARYLRVGQPSPISGRHGSREWELTRWFKRVAVFLDGVCHLANHQGEIEALLAVPLDADGRSMAHWGVRRWRGGPWELDNLELDYQLRHNPSALFEALEAFAALLPDVGFQADHAPWPLVG